MVAAARLEPIGVDMLAEKAACIAAAAGGAAATGAAIGWRRGESST